MYPTSTAGGEQRLPGGFNFLCEIIPNGNPMNKKPKQKRRTIGLQRHAMYSGPVKLRTPVLTSAEHETGRKAVASFHERQRLVAAQPHADAKRRRKRRARLAYLDMVRYVHDALIGDVAEPLAMPLAVATVDTLRKNI